MTHPGYYFYRAKLLHDAWNLAYAGDLSFATAFNMTLFMKYEKEHLVWNPVFTLIDHIGNHIDMSSVHKKFEVKLGHLFFGFSQGTKTEIFVFFLNPQDIRSNSTDTAVRRTWSRGTGK